MAPSKYSEESRIVRLEEADADLRERTARIEAKLDHVVDTLDRVADGLAAVKGLEPRVVELERIETRRRSLRKWLAGVATPIVVAVVLVLLGLK